MAPLSTAQKLRDSSSKPHDTHHLRLAIARGGPNRVEKAPRASALQCRMLLGLQLVMSTVCELGVRPPLEDTNLRGVLQLLP